MTKFQKRTLSRQSFTVIILLSAVLFQLPAFAANPSINRSIGEMRLIQVDEREQAWMSLNDIEELSARNHEQGRCGGFMDITWKLNKYNLAKHGFQNPPYFKDSVQYDNKDSIKDIQALRQALRSVLSFSDRRPSHTDEVNRLMTELSAQGLHDDVKVLSSFKNRYYKSESGVAAAEWIKNRFLALAAGRTDITVELFKHDSFPQPSVIAKIKGTGLHANERVILGAHEDSINRRTEEPRTTARAPGADDDASGVSTLLETFRVLAQSGFQPDRTIEFITYAGEEVGLLGSQQLANQYREEGISIAAVLQLDMTFFPGTHHTINLISDHVDHSLTRFVETLIDSYIKVPWTEGGCGYACSDHASWDREGYSAAFPFESQMKELNPRIHTENDSLDSSSLDSYPLDNYLDEKFGLNFAKLAVAFALEIGLE